MYKQSKRFAVAKEQMSFEDYLADLAQDDLPATPSHGSCDIRPQLRGILNEAIRESGMSRDEVAEEMSRLVGEKISVDQINGWTRETDQRHVPAQYMYAFEVATKSRAITEYFCKLHHGKFINAQADEVLTLGQIQLYKAQLTVKEKELKEKLRK